MHMTILYENGLRAEAVLLATGNFHLRVIVRGGADTTELQRIEDQWKTEEGTAVEIESLVTDDVISALPCYHSHAA